MPEDWYCEGGSSFELTGIITGIKITTLAEIKALIEDGE